MRLSEEITQKVMNKAFDLILEEYKIKNRRRATQYPLSGRMWGDFCVIFQEAGKK